MMGKNKKDILCLCYVPFAMIFAVWVAKITVNEFYQGAPFLAVMEYHTNFFLLYFARVLFTFGDFEQYFHGYGVVNVIRHRKKQRLFFHSVGRLLGKVLLFQLFALLCICLLSAVLLPESDISLGELAGNFAIYCMVDFAQALFQMLLEIVFDGRIGACGAGAYYILSIILSDKLYFQPFGKNVMWLFLPNLGMAKRVEECGYSVGLVLVVVAVAVILLLLAGMKVVKRKDIL